MKLKIAHYAFQYDLQAFYDQIDIFDLSIPSYTLIRTELDFSIEEVNRALVREYNNAYSDQEVYIYATDDFFFYKCSYDSKFEHYAVYKKDGFATYENLLAYREEQGEGFYPVAAITITTYDATKPEEEFNFPLDVKVSVS